MKLAEKIAKNVQKYRHKKGLSLSMLATKSKVPLFSIQKLLYREKQNTGLENLIRIANALDISLDDIVR